MICARYSYHRCRQEYRIGINNHTGIDTSKTIPAAVRGGRCKPTQLSQRSIEANSTLSGSPDGTWSLPDATFVEFST
jgi:hypothetical protein